MSKKSFASVSLRDRNTINCQKPDGIILRLFEVLSSWQKNTSEFINFAESNLSRFLRKNWNRLYIHELINEIRIESRLDNKLHSNSPFIDTFDIPDRKLLYQVVNYVKWKLRVLGGIEIGSPDQPFNKMLRLVWFEGLRSNRLQFHIYPDVKKCLEKLQKMKIPLILYSCVSCGEIWNSKSLLGFTLYGDLTNLFTDFIDTNSSPVYQNPSYESLLAKFGPKSKLLFITSNLKEARFAQRNNINPMLIIRDHGLVDIADQYFDDIPAISHLNELNILV